MLGLQEILIISTIVIGAICIPRMVQQKKPAPRLVRSRRKISGKMRLSMAASIVFPLIAAAFLQPWRNDPVPYFYLGVGPVLLGWLLYWVVLGFRRR
jgi:hypothetical protein